MAGTCPYGFPLGGGLMGAAAHLMAGCCNNKEEKMSNKTQVRRTFTVDPATCPEQIMLPKHWNEDGTCKCKKNLEDQQKVQSETRMKHVTQILGGAWSALELLTVKELEVLERDHAARANQGHSIEIQARNTAITLFIRTAREWRNR